MENKKVINRDTLARRVWNDIEGATLKDSRLFVDTVLDNIYKALVNGEDVKLLNFGIFEINEITEKKGVIGFGDKKGQQYITPAHNVIKFRPCNELKELVWEIKGKEAE